jgi:hypothetical protein
MLNSALIFAFRKNIPYRKEDSLIKAILFFPIHDAFGRLFTLHHSSLKVSMSEIILLAKPMKSLNFFHFERIW